MGGPSATAPCPQGPRFRQEAGSGRSLRTLQEVPTGTTHAHPQPFVLPKSLEEGV